MYCGLESASDDGQQTILTATKQLEYKAVREARQHQHHHHHTRTYFHAECTAACRAGMLGLLIVIQWFDVQMQMQLEGGGTISAIRSGPV